MEAVIQIIKEGVCRIFLTGIGIGEHSFAAHIVQCHAELGQSDLVAVTEILRHIGGTVIRLVDRLVGRIEIEEGFLPRIFPGLAVIAVQNGHALKQLVVGAYHVLFQDLRTVAGPERHGQFPFPVYRIDAVITGAHEEDEQCGAGNVIRTVFVEEPAFLHEIVFSLRMSFQGMVFLLDAGKCSNQRLVVILYDPVDIYQALVGIIDYATDLRIALSDSEEQGTATHERFHIGFHLSEIGREGFCQYGKESSLSTYPGEAGLSGKAAAFLFLCHKKTI